MNKYRFDDQTKRVYQYDKSADTYLFIGTYKAFEIHSKMSDDIKSDIVDFELDMRTMEG